MQRNSSVVARTDTEAQDNINTTTIRKKYISVWFSCSEKSIKYYFGNCSLESWNINKSYLRRAWAFYTLCLVIVSDQLFMNGYLNSFLKKWMKTLCICWQMEMTISFIEIEIVQFNKRVINSVVVFDVSMKNRHLLLHNGLCQFFLDSFYSS